MAIEFKVPQLAEGITSADVADISVKEGDTITAGQTVMELETEKAVMPLPCPHAGKVTKIHVKTGDTVNVGQTILTLEAVGAEKPSGGKPAPQAAEKAKQPPAQQPSRQAPKETAAAEQQEPSEREVKQTQKAAATARPAARPAAPRREEGNGGGPIPAGPATRRLARELGINLEALHGSGPGGRITQEDVARAYAGRNGAGGGGGIAVPPLPDFTQFGEVERQPLSKLARTGANNLSVAWQVIPHVTQHDLADITELEAARKRYQEAIGKNGPKVTMTAVAIKAAVAALKEFPHVNASLDTNKNELVLKRYYHIGVAVDTPAGLVVPVIRDADQKTILELAAELTEVAEKARNRRLELKDMQGGTFTITNLGGIGGTAFTPIVNYPEVAILGMSRTQQQLRINNGEPETRLMLPLSLSYDHRVINGADAARFVVKLVGLFSDAFKLLIEA